MKKFLILVSLMFMLLPVATNAAKTEWLYLLKDDFSDSYKALVVRTASLYKNELWVIEYGIGCSSMWRYEDKLILASYSNYLDGVGGKFYLTKHKQTCKNWDAKPISDIIDDLRDEDWEWLSDNGYLNN